MAVAWAKRAAEGGVATALFILSEAYMKGAGGVDKDEGEGLRLLRSAASQGHPSAQIALGKVEAV